VGGFVDPEEVFGAIFSGEKFLPLIGQLSLARGMKTALQEADASGQRWCDPNLPSSYADACSFPPTSSINIRFRPFWTCAVSKTKCASFEVVLPFSATFTATATRTSIL
jgi:hypothetical protein